MNFTESPHAENPPPDRRRIPAFLKNNPEVRTRIEAAYAETGIARDTVVVTIRDLARRHAIEETATQADKIERLYDQIVLRLARYPRQHIGQELAGKPSTPLLSLFHMGLLATNSLNRFVLRTSQDELPRLTKDIAAFDSMDFHAIYNPRGSDRVLETMIWHDIAKRSDRFAFAPKA